MYMPPPFVALLCVNEQYPLKIRLLLEAYNPPPWHLESIALTQLLQLPMKLLLPSSVSLLLLTPSAVPVLFSNEELVMSICSTESMNSANFCVMTLGGSYITSSIPTLLCIPHEVNTR